MTDTTTEYEFRGKYAHLLAEGMDDTVILTEDMVEEYGVKNFDVLLHSIREAALYHAKRGYADIRVMLVAGDEEVFMSTVPRENPYIPPAGSHEATRLEKIVMQTSKAANLSEMTIPELKALADENGVEYKYNVKKADLIVALSA